MPQSEHGAAEDAKSLSYNTAVVVVVAMGIIVRSSSVGGKSASNKSSWAVVDSRGSCWQY